MGRLVSCGHNARAVVAAAVQSTGSRAPKANSSIAAGSLADNAAAVAGHVFVATGRCGHSSDAGVRTKRRSSSSLTASSISRCAGSATVISRRAGRRRSPTEIGVPAGGGTRHRRSNRPGSGGSWGRYDPIGACCQSMHAAAWLLGLPPRAAFSASRTLSSVSASAVTVARATDSSWRSRGT